MQGAHSQFLTGTFIYYTCIFKDIKTQNTKVWVQTVNNRIFLDCNATIVFILEVYITFWWLGGAC